MGNPARGFTVTSGSVVSTSSAVPTTTAALRFGTPNAVVQENLTGTVTATDYNILSYTPYLYNTGPSSSALLTRRLRVDGVRIASAIVTAIAGSNVVASWYINYGSTLASGAGIASDTANTKAYRRIALDLTQMWTSGQAAGTAPLQIGTGYCQFANPIYVNAGETLLLTSSIITTGAITAGVIQHNLTFDFCWE